MYKGSCLCGAVTFSITGTIEDIVMCHCSLCRKAQGSTYATNGVVNEDDFTLKGAGKLIGYESSKGNTKYFCHICGSPIFSRNKNHKNKVRIRLETIESDIQERPIAHVIVSSKANWDHITDELPQYNGHIDQN